MSSEIESAKGWMAEHPEEQQVVHFANDQTTNLFRELDPAEEADFRQHARETYVIGDPINEIFHPVWKDEARKMNLEVANESTARRSGE